jgi:hypothetical protein
MGKGQQPAGTRQLLHRRQDGDETNLAVNRQREAAEPLGGLHGPGKAEPYPVLRISFQFQVGTGKPLVWPLTVAAPERP